MFDKAIYACFPRGIYLAKKIALSGYKVAYVDLKSKRQRPFGLFMDDNLVEHKDFLESLGFLSTQEEGLSVFSPEGYWPLQRMREMRSRIPSLVNGFERGVKELENEEMEFKTKWLYFLSQSLTSRNFIGNELSLKRGLPFFSEYLLFSEDVRKKEQFKKENDSISFFEMKTEDINVKEINETGKLSKLDLKAKSHLILEIPGKNAIYEWRSLSFQADFQSYSDKIPSHFVVIKDLFLPWSLDNLLSVFYENNKLEVWLRSFKSDDISEFLISVKELLEKHFPGAKFIYKEGEGKKGPLVYAKEDLPQEPEEALISKSRLYLDNLQDFHHWDLGSLLISEENLFRKLKQS